MAATSDRTWFITGASSGFGRALAEAVLARGERVAATARRPETVADLAEANPGRALALRLDVTRPEQIQAALKAAKDAFGRIDVLVNNAGFGAMGVVEDTSDATFRRVFDTNVFGLVNVARAALPILRDQGSGHILNVSSSGGQAAFPTMGAYAGSKFAVEGVSEALAAEVAPLGIKVTIVEPGGFETDFGKSLDMTPVSEPYAAAQAAVAEAIKGGVFGDPRGAVRAMIAVVDSPAPPLRLAIGADAVAMMRGALQRRLADLDAWEAVSKDVAAP